MLAGSLLYVLSFCLFGAAFSAIMSASYFTATALLIGAILSFVIGRIAFKGADEESKKEIENWERQQEIAKRNEGIFSHIIGKLIDVQYLGGSGYDFRRNQILNFGIASDSILLANQGELVSEIAFDSIVECEVSGPGTVVTNAGASGGGFGLEGFLQGAVAAAVINAATSMRKTNTFLRILTTSGDMYFHTSDIEPTDLKMNLSPLWVNISSRSIQSRESVSIFVEVKNLQKLLQEEIITKEEFEMAKKKILS